VNILVISYFFPPYKRVGGRRWAKLVKHLSRLEENCFVLAGEFSNDQSSWDEDIVGYANKIKRVHLKSKRIRYFERKLPSNLFEKLLWKASYVTYLLRRRWYKGNYLDVSYNSSDEFVHPAIQLVDRHGIDVVILSCGPFYYSNVLLKLRELRPHVKLIVDYRDSREDSQAGLTQTQISFEDVQQKRVLKIVDLALCVNEEIRGKLTDINPELTAELLPHAVDEDYTRFLKGGISRRSIKPNRLIYGGELYGGLEPELSVFHRFFSELSGLVEDCSADFYLSYPTYDRFFKRNDRIRSHAFLSKIDFQQEMLASGYVLLFRPSWSLNAFSSKFFEILVFKKPIIYFGQDGLVGEFLVRNNLGFHFNEDRFESELIRFKSNFETKLVPNIEFDLKPYTFDFQARRLQKILNDCFSR
jgi:hypothetical protein